MLKLKTLKFKNIGRFITEQVIDFSSLSGLIQADAQNKNTGGSSGAGKTTVFMALEYLLGINDTPVTILQSRLTKEALSVEGEFDLDGTPIAISRSKKGLIISTAPDTHGSSKLAEEALDKILGMPRDLFRVLMHKRQKEGGFFLNFTPKETHAFLVDAKGLNEHTKKAEEIDKDVTKLEESKKSLESGIASTEAALNSTLEAIKSVGEPPEPSKITGVQLTQLSGQVQEAESLVKDIDSIHSKQRSELANEKPALSATAFNRSKIVAIESSLSDNKLRLHTLERAEVARQSGIKDILNSTRINIAMAKSAVENGEKAKLEAKKIVQEINKLKEGQCPTCEQTWTNESAKIKETKLLQAFEIQKSLILAGVEAVSKQKSLEESAAALSYQAQPIPVSEMPEILAQDQILKTELANERKLEAEHNAKESLVIKQANDTYITKMAALATKQTAEMSVIKDQYATCFQVLNAAKSEFTTAKMSVDRYNETVAKLNTQKFHKEFELDKKKSELTEITEKLEIVKEAKLLVKSFISCSFDDALEAIGDKATQIIRGVPNMATATIQLEGMRETKEGKVKEEVTAVIHMDGEQAVPIKSLSGGERSAVDLAIDLAVIDFLEAATGKGMDLFILDEPFTGLDSVSIEQVLEVLQSSNMNKKLIIVDHNEVIKQFVQNKILVVREGETSNVES